MKTEITCLVINLVCAGIFSIPTVAFLASDTPIISNTPEPVSINVSEAVEAMDITPSLVPTEPIPEPVEDVTEVTEEVTETDILEEPIDEHKYFDVPLDHNLQDHIFVLCEEANIDPAIVIAIIETESRYEYDAIGDNGKAQGLMQVQQRWHYDRMDELGITNLLDPYQNVTVGIHFLEELIRLGGGSLEWALMAYNGGHGLANKRAAVVVEYARTVMTRAWELNN